MPTPTKPAKVIAMEKKSHRTKTELKHREVAEKSLLSSETMRERIEVRENKIAHKEYLRIEKILKKIDKNDALYEPIINRFCMIQAECKELEDRREEFYELVRELREIFKEATRDMQAEEKAEYLIEFSREMARMSGSMINCDKQIQAKRKMLLEIEKECVMTIASSLRSIPKKVENKTNALLEALGR